jgi:hypothetical protein
MTPPRKLKAWQDRSARVVVLRDRGSAHGEVLKAERLALCEGRAATLRRGRAQTSRGVAGARGAVMTHIVECFWRSRALRQRGNR